MKRILKPLIVGATGFSIVILIFSALMPDQVMTSKWVVVAQNKDTVIQVIRDLQTWPSWNGLLSGATALQVTDSSLAWRSVNDKACSVRLESIADNGLSTPISLGDQAVMRAGFSVEQRKPDSVQVVWFVIEDLRWYPWEKFYGMMAADRKGPLMQQSLDDLKNLLQTR